MKSDQSLVDLKILKFSEHNCYRIEFDFFMVNFPVRPELVFLSPFVYQEYERKYHK